MQYSTLYRAAGSLVIPLILSPHHCHLLNLWISQKYHRVPTHIASPSALNLGEASFLFFVFQKNASSFLACRRLRSIIRDLDL